MSAAFLLASCGGHAIRAPVGDLSKGKPPVSGYHLVRSGDSLYSIAWQYNLNADNLASWNQIRSPFTIYRDQRLRLTRPAQMHKQTRSSSASKKPVIYSKSGSQFQDKTKPSPSKKKTASPKETAMTKRLTGNEKVIWAWPVKGGAQKARKASSVKKGIRISGRTGDPVRAAAAGKVVYAGSGLTGYGKLIIIKHNADYLSAYAHNRKLLAKEGEVITLGQKVALMGHSGVNVTQLYFEIRKNGSPVNPLKYLPR